jgi:hypothetical protein
MTVVEDHNLRKGDMSSAELDQCMSDLAAWWDGANAEGKSGGGEGKGDDGDGGGKHTDAAVPAPC